MIRAIPDTNVILRGMFGYGSPHRKVLSLAALKKVQLYGCAETLKEFCEKAYMEKFQRFWSPKHFTPDKVILDYKSVIIMHEPTPAYSGQDIPIEDPDDAVFFKIALSSGIQLIVSEDKHLKKLDGYQGIRVISAQQFVDAYTKTKGSLGLSSVTPK